MDVQAGIRCGVCENCESRSSESGRCDSEQMVLRGRTVGGGETSPDAEGDAEGIVRCTAPCDGGGPAPRDVSGICTNKGKRSADIGDK